MARVKITKQPATKGVMSSGGLSVVFQIKKTGRLDKGILPSRTYERYIHQLNSLGVIRKLGYGVWQADMAKYWELWHKTTRQNSGGGGHPIRGHGFHWKLSLPCLLPLEKLGAYLSSHGIGFRQSADKHGLGLTLKGYKVWIYPGCAMFYCPKGRDFMAWTARDSSRQAYDDILGIIRSLEVALGDMSLRFSNGYKLQCTHQHYAHIRDALAKLVQKDERYLEVRDKNGELWLLFDKSMSYEQETVSPRTAVRDWDKIIAPFYNDIWEHYDKTGELLTLTGLLRIMQPSQDIDDSKNKKLADYIG